MRSLVKTGLFTALHIELLNERSATGWALPDRLSRPDLEPGRNF